jgi:hypothetical protein
MAAFRNARPVSDHIVAGLAAQLIIIGMAATLRDAQALHPSHCC